MINYRVERIGGVDYRVCNICDTMNLANFECPNCRKDMRRRSCCIEIADIIDQRQGLTSILQCPRCENEEIEPDHNYCKICGLKLH